MLSRKLSLDPRGAHVQGPEKNRILEGQALAKHCTCQTYSILEVAPLQASVMRNLRVLQINGACYARVLDANTAGKPDVWVRGPEQLFEKRRSEFLTLHIHLFACR